MNWTRDDISRVIEFSKQHGGDCSMLVSYVVYQVLKVENPELFKL
jgi:hypothetical protein